MNRILSLLLNVLPIIHLLLPINVLPTSHLPLFLLDVLPINHPNLLLFLQYSKRSRNRRKARWSNTARKLSKFGVILVHIFPHLDLIRRDNPYLSVFSPNGENMDQNNSKHGHLCCERQNEKEKGQFSIRREQHKPEKGQSPARRR